MSEEGNTEQGAATDVAASSGSAPWEGKRVGPFRIVGFLGRGAMARVFRAEDLRLKRFVALKVFPSQINSPKGQVRLQRFLREAKSGAALEHAGIVRVYEVGESNGVCFIAQELIEGGPVGRMLDANGPFDIVRACQIGAEVGEALEFAHDHGVVHRDVKPDNILLGRGGKPKLSDFGLAFRADPEDAGVSLEEAVGTAFFIAPEICRGQGATPLSDQYSLAASIWYMLTGKPPFSGSSRTEVIEQQVRSPLPDLRQLRPDLPDGLVKAIYKALAKNPEDRYLSCDQFAKVLRVYTIPPPAPAASPIPQLTASAAVVSPHPLHSNAVKHLLIVLIGLVIVLSLALTYMVMDRWLSQSPAAGVANPSSTLSNP